MIRLDIDKNTMDNIKNMVDNGDLNGAIAQISPEMIQNFSKLFASQQNSSSNAGFEQSSSTASNSQSGNSQFDVSQIMKLAESLNGQNNDPRNNLLNSLKPYLRDSRKAKLDNYMNLMNMSKIAEIVKNTSNTKPEN